MGRIAEANLNDVQFHPETEIQEGEVELGVLQDEEAQRLFIMADVLGCQAKKTAETLLEKYGETTDKGLSTEAKAEINQLVALKEEIELLRSLFWHSVSLQFPKKYDDDRHSYGIRKGWKIVSIPEAESRIMVVGMPLGMMFGLR